MSTDTHQLFDGQTVDTLVNEYLDAYNIDVVRIQGRPEIANLSADQQRELFYDWNHLSKEGHRMWARIINNDLKRILRDRD